MKPCPVGPDFDLCLIDFRVLGVKQHITILNDALLLDTAELLCRIVMEYLNAEGIIEQNSVISILENTVKNSKKHNIINWLYIFPDLSSWLGKKLY